MEQYIGYIAAFLTTTSFVPQAVRVIMTRNTEGISRNMYILFNVGILFWIVYGFMRGEMPLILANLITLIFSGTILFYKLRE